MPPNASFPTKQEDLPDQSTIERDGYGRPLYLYSVCHELDGRHFTFNIRTYGDENADARFESIRNTAVFAGYVAEPVAHDARGPIYRGVVAYYHNDLELSFEMPVYDEQDGEARLASIKENGYVDSVILATGTL